MMRILLLLFIAFVFTVSGGCGEAKKKSQYADNPNADPSSGERSRAPKPLTPGGSKGDDSKSEKDEEKADDKKKTDGEEKADDKKAEEKKTEVKKKPPVRRGGGRAPRPTLGGGDSTETNSRPPITPEDDRSRRNGNNSDSDDKKEEKKDVFVSFLDRANEAFSKGHDPEAFQYLYAHALADEDALRLHPMAWYPGINQPRLGLRWGVGISYRPGSFEGDPPKIGKTVLKDGASKGGDTGGGELGSGGGLTLGNGRSGNGRSGRGSGGSSRGSNDKSPEELLDYYTGEFGEQFVVRYEKRRKHEDAFYGELLKTAGEGSFSESKAEEKKSSSGNRNQSDDGGLSNASSGANAPASSQSVGAADDSAYEAKKTSLAPGLMMIGTGKKAELVAKAKALNLDVFVHFAVHVKHNERTSTTKTYVQMFVYKVKSAKDDLVSSKVLNDYSVAKARDSKRGGDPIEDELDKVFKENADKVFRASETPKKYTAELFKKRFDFLLNKDFDNPLPVLVEMKNYAEAGYISENDYRSACEKFLGETETADLMDGDMKKREFALRRFLPGEFDFEAKVDDEDDL